MKNKKTHTISLLICPLLVFVILNNPFIIMITPAQQTGRTLYVCSKGTTRYSTIQQAIQKARHGDTVFIYNGIYQENIQITKSITLQGEHKQSTILQPYNDYTSYIICISSDNVTISGFTIQKNKKNIYNAAIVIDNSQYTTIKNNSIQNCNQGIVLLQNTTNTAIVNNNFINNSNDISDNKKTNFFNTTYPIGGNYWDTYVSRDDYSGVKQNKFGSDGIYDTPYTIDNSNYSDYYPYINKNGWEHVAPLASINGPYIAYINQTILFDGTQSKTNEKQLTYSWDFGDNANGFGEICTHTYQKPGTYTVCLTITDTKNCTNTTSTYAYIYDTKKGTHSIHATYDSFISQKNKNQSYGSQTYLKTSNDFGENISDYYHHTLLFFNLSSIPKLIKIHNVSLSLYYYQSDSNNSHNRKLSVRRITSDWHEDNVTWYTRPLNASRNSTIASIPEQFGWIKFNVTKDVISFINGNNTNYGWMIMDLESWGKKNIPLILFKSKETITSYQPYLHIRYSTPLLAYSSKVYEARVGEEIVFNGSYMGAAIYPLDWLWDFGEGNTSTQRNTTFSYDKSGKYFNSLSVTDSTGKSSTFTATVFITEENQNTKRFSITSPKTGFYLFNTLIKSLRSTIIFGDIDIVVDVFDKNISIEKIDIYCNNHLKYTLFEIPFVCRWEKHTIFPLRNSIRVVMYESNGRIYEERLSAIRFL